MDFEEVTNEKQRLKIISELKTDWGPGPWDSEPDYEEFVFSGLRCVLRRRGSGTWVGAIGVPSEWIDVIEKFILRASLSRNTWEVKSTIHQPYVVANKDVADLLSSEKYPVCGLWVSFDFEKDNTLVPALGTTSDGFLENTLHGFGDYFTFVEAKEALTKEAKQLLKTLNMCGVLDDNHKQN